MDSTMQYVADKILPEFVNIEIKSRVFYNNNVLPYIFDIEMIKKINDSEYVRKNEPEFLKTFEYFYNDINVSEDQLTEFEVFDAFQFKYKNEKFFCLRMWKGFHTVNKKIESVSMYLNLMLLVNEKKDYAFFDVLKSPVRLKLLDDKELKYYLRKFQYDIPIANKPILGKLIDFLSVDGYFDVALDVIATSDFVKNMETTYIFSTICLSFLQDKFVLKDKTLALEEENLENILKLGIKIFNIPPDEKFGFRNLLKIEKYLDGFVLRIFCVNSGCNLDIENPMEALETIRILFINNKVEFFRFKSNEFKEFEYYGEFEIFDRFHGALINNVDDIPIIKDIADTLNSLGPQEKTQFIIDYSRFELMFENIK